MGLLLASALALGSCQGASEHPYRSYPSAEEATAAEDWPRAAELWFDVHQREGVKTQHTYLQTARALYKSGDTESACGMLTRGLADFPYDTELLAYKAGLLEKCGFERAAEPLYSRLVDVDPSNVPALIALGRIRAGLGLERSAIGPLEAAVLLAPDAVEAHRYLAETYACTGRELPAFRSYSSAIEQGLDDPDALLAAARLATHSEVVAGVAESRRIALGWLDELVARDPQCTQAHYLRGRYLQALERSEEAIEAFTRAVETDPGCLVALTRLATLYAEQGDVVHTAEMVERALEIEEDPTRRETLEALVVGR